MFSPDFRKSVGGAVRVIFWPNLAEIREKSLNSFTDGTKGRKLVTDFLAQLTPLGTKCRKKTPRFWPIGSKGQGGGLSKT